MYIGHREVAGGDLSWIELAQDRVLRWEFK
jgi:hypothetical protein